jgi:hypothetical protein
VPVTAGTQCPDRAAKIVTVSESRNLVMRNARLRYECLYQFGYILRL